jgi:hypothetical protein
MAIFARGVITPGCLSVTSKGGAGIQERLGKLLNKD